MLLVQSGWNTCVRNFDEKSLATDHIRCQVLMGCECYCLRIVAAVGGDGSLGSVRKLVIVRCVLHHLLRDVSVGDVKACDCDLVPVTFLCLSVISSRLHGSVYRTVPWSLQDSFTMLH